MWAISARERGVRLKLRGLSFGKTAADEEAIGVGKPAIRQRVEEAKLGARALEGFEIVGIIEAESAVAGDGDADILQRRPAGARPRSWQGAAGRTCRDFKQAIEVRRRFRSPGGAFRSQRGRRAVSIGVISPRCRSSMAKAPSRGSAPSTGMPV